MKNKNKKDNIDTIKRKSVEMLAIAKRYSLLGVKKISGKFFDTWSDFFSLFKVTTATKESQQNHTPPPNQPNLSQEDIEKIQQAMQEAAGNGSNELMFGKKLKEQIDSLIPSKRTKEKAQQELLTLIKENNSVKKMLLAIGILFITSILVLTINALFIESSFIYWVFAYLNVASYSYILGSTPSAYIIVRYNSNKDLRKVGSGNIGSTNVVRAAGYKWAGITLFLDITKAIIAVAVTKMFFATNVSSIEYFAGIVAFIGHIYPFWMNFQGGKGVASAFGVIAFLKPIVGLIGLLAWLLSIATTRVSSLSSLVAALFTLGAAYAFSHDDRGYFIMCIAMVAIIVFKHKSNIRSIYMGEEKPVKHNKDED